MAVTFIDPPGSLGNTSEPIDFTTTGAVTSISVEFNPSIGNGLRETVFDGTNDPDNLGGDFSFRYRESSRSGNGPYMWTIRRAGRWPAGFRIRVKEQITQTPVVSDLVTVPLALSAGNNFDMVTSPSVSNVLCIALGTTVACNLNGLAAPTDQTKLHWLRLVNRSTFTVTIPHLDAGNASPENAIYVLHGAAISPNTGIDLVWIPASLTPFGLSRWYSFSQG